MRAPQKGPSPLRASKMGLLILTLYLVSVLTAKTVSYDAPEGGNKVSYKGHHAIRLGVGDNASKIKRMMKDLSLSTWNGDPQANNYVDLVVPQSQLEAFRNSTATMDIQIMHEDLDASIEADAKHGAYSGSATLAWFDSYHPYADHLRFLSGLQSQYKANSRIIFAGNSSQGQAITGIHIYGKKGKGANPAVVFHGTVHAREWVTTLVVEYIAFQLLGNYEGDNEIKNIVDTQDFYIFPVVNPDGFVYTQTTDRLWRKNRQPVKGISCPGGGPGSGEGRDIARNWPYQWDVPIGGASTDPCDERFKGLAPGDATETSSLSSHLNTLAAETGVKLYIDFHSYSQLILSPYGYSCDVVAATKAEHHTLASGVADSIKAVYGTGYQTGPICTTIYPVSGGSVDYAYDVVKANYSYTFELRDTGLYGFLLPAHQILPSSVETFAGVKYLLENAK